MIPASKKKVAGKSPKNPHEPSTAGPHPSAGLSKG